MRHGRNVLVALLASGCVPPPDAPEDLDALSRFLYREQAWPSPLVPADGMENLRALLAAVPDLEGTVMDRSWSLSDLTVEDVQGLPERPDRDPALAAGVAVAYRSQRPIVDHARAQTEADQRPFEATAPDHYDRSFLNTEDPSCFIDGTCEVLETFNDATRENLLMTITFELRKDFRWLTLPDGRRGFLARSWYERSWNGERENVTVWQSYSVDAWIEADDPAQTLRFQTLWSETDLGVPISDEAVVATVRGGIDDFFKQFDEAAAERYQP